MKTKPKVDDLDLEVTGKQYVLHLDITMHYILRVEILKNSYELFHEVGCLALVELLDVLVFQVVREGDVLQKLRDYVYTVLCVDRLNKLYD